MATIRSVLTAESGGTARILGGLFVAVGAVALLVRRTSFEDPWGDFLVLLVLAVLVKVFFWSGFLGARWSDGTRPWQVVYVLIGIALVAPTLFQFVEWVDGNTAAPLNITWIFLATAPAPPVRRRLSRSPRPEQISGKIDALRRRS